MTRKTRKTRTRSSKPRQRQTKPNRASEAAIAEASEALGEAHGHREPVLRFTPYAWAKLVYFCQRGNTEIGGFGLTAEDDPLLVIDLLTLKQRVSSVSVEFDDEAVADLFDEQVDTGVQPYRFARVWCHTHPGDSADPSGTDEETFARVFGRCDWAVMMILAKRGQTYARLRFNVGPGGESLIPVQVDYAQPFQASDHEAWEQAYQEHVHPIAEAHATFSAFDEFDEIAPETWPVDEPEAMPDMVSLHDLDELEDLIDESEVQP